MIEIEHLNKTFGTLQAVKDLSLTIPRGELFCFLGPNGAGKTTTIKVLCGLLKPTIGTIRIRGIDIQADPAAVRRLIGYIPDTPFLYERLTPKEVVKYYADLHHMDKGEYERRREQLFTQLGINEFQNRRVAKLSTGMKQKVSIARTLIHDPEVVVFDEPTAGLDVITARGIIDLIREFRERGKTVIFSTHIMGEVSLLSDDLAIIHGGKLIYSGAYQDFVAQMKTKSLEDEFIKLVEEA